MTYQEIINEALKLGLEEVEIYANESISNNISLFNSKVDTFSLKELSGLSIRGLYNNHMGYVYTESTTDEDIKKSLHKLLENAKNLSNDEREFIFDGKAVYQDVRPMEADFDKFTTKEKIELLKEIETKTKNVDARIRLVQPKYVENKSITKIINSKGVNLARKEEYCYLLLSVDASENDQTTSGNGIDINTSYEKLDVNNVIKDATEMALNSLGAGFVKSGKYPIVFSRDAASDLLSAFGSMFSGENALKKMSILTDKIGVKFFGSNITIINDPFCKKALAEYSFDDEAVPCQKIEVVKDGIFNTFLHSQKTAAFFNTKSTGNGFKAGAQGSIMVSPVNMYLKEGTKTKDEIIATVEDGLYVTDVTGLHAGLNPISGNFNVQSSGFLIKNGKLSSPVTLFVISGNFFELMNNVEEIGNDIKERFDGIVSPTLKVKSMSVSGK